MAENSKIEWCHHTFNPWWGCFEVSPACVNCYARELGHRFGTDWGIDTPRREFGDKHWSEPLRWNAKAEKAGVRHRVFCASMADVFDKNAPAGARERLWALIEATPNLDWLLLTKRIGNVRHMIPDRWSVSMPENVWLGISIVNQEEADRDIPKLLSMHANVHWLSMEPLLGSVNISRWLDPTGVTCIDVCPDKRYIADGEIKTVANDRNEVEPICPDCGLVASWTGYDDGLDWVVVGGESGNKARPMHPDWVRSLRDQCAAAGVPFLFKQWGEWSPDDAGETAHKDTVGILPSGDCAYYSQGYVAPFDNMERLLAAGLVRLDGRTLMDHVGKKRAGRLLDGVQHDGYPGIAA